jgi:hypothetical protein
MKAPVFDPVIAPAPEVFPSSSPAGEANSGYSAPRGPIRYRFVLKFAAQMSTPCSRGLAVKPRAGRVLARRAPRLFQSYLQRHSVLQ